MSYQNIDPDKWYANAAARIADQAHFPARKLAGDEDTGDVWLRTATGWVQIKINGATPVLEQNPASQRINATQWVVGDDTTTVTVVDGDLSGWIDISKFDRDASSILLVVAGTNNFQLDVKLSYDGVSSFMTKSNPLGGALAAGTNYTLALNNANLPYAPFIKLAASGTVATPTLKAILVGQAVEV